LPSPLTLPPSMVIPRIEFRLELIPASTPVASEKPPVT
jgi:hypothetical protein